MYFRCKGLEMFYHPDTTGTISTQCHASRTDARASVTAGYVWSTLHGV